MRLESTAMTIITPRDRLVALLARFIPLSTAVVCRRAGTSNALAAVITPLEREFAFILLSTIVGDVCRRTGVAAVLRIEVTDMDDTRRRGTAAAAEERRTSRKRREARLKPIV